MQQTTNLHLNKPEYNEAADIQVINGNMDTIDAKIKQNTDAISEISGDVDDIGTAVTGLNTSVTDINTAMAKLPVFIATIENVSSLQARYPASGTNSGITNDMVCVKSIISVPSAMGSDWTVTTYNGYLTVTGTFSGSTATDITLYLMKKRS